MFRQIRTGVALLALAAAVACSDSDGSRSAVSDAVVSNISEAKPGNIKASMQSAELVPVSFTAWESQRKEFVPKIVVVDLWATWCTPCLERFPHMVEMHNRYKDKGVLFVSLSLDDREDASSIEFARTFLKQQNAYFPNFLLDENIIDGFDKIGIQTVPAVNVYDRSGKLVRELNNNNPNDQFTDEDIERVVVELLGN